MAASSTMSTKTANYMVVRHSTTHRKSYLVYGINHHLFAFFYEFLIYTTAIGEAFTTRSIRMVDNKDKKQVLQLSHT